MADKTKNLFTGAKARIRATKRVLGKDTMADFRMSSGGLGSIFGNAATTQGHLGRQLTAHNRVIAQGMSRLADRNSDRVRGDIGGGQREAANLFGVAGGAGARESLISGKADAKANRLVSTQAAKGGKTLARAGNEAMAIQGQAVQEAASGADYALANAFAVRNMANAETVAQMQSDLASQRLDARLNERYLRLQDRLSGDGTTGGTGSAGFGQAAGYLQDLVDSGASQTDVEAKVASLKIQYNLGPNESKRLDDMVSALFGGEGAAPGAVTTSPEATAFSEDHGMSPSAFLPAAVESATNLAVQRAYRDEPGAKLDQAKALDIIGVEVQNVDGKSVYVSSASGTPVPEDMVAASIAYVFTTWARLQAREGAEPAAAAGTPAKPRVIASGSANVRTQTNGGSYETTPGDIRPDGTKA
jgi:hypothetical protein